MAKFTIQDISKILVARNGLNKKDASTFANVMFDIIQQALERERIVKVKGLGTFKIIDVEARESVNVNTGERVLIEKHDKITFTPDTLMKELVNKPFSQFDTVVLKEGVDFDDTAKGEASVEQNHENIVDPVLIPLVDFEDSVDEPGEILTPAPEPYQESKSESVLEPTPALEPVSESVPAPVPVFETEPSLEPESASELAEVSEKEPEPLAVEEPEPLSEEPVTLAVEEPRAPVQDYGEEESEVESEEASYDEETSSSKNWLMLLIASLLGLLIGYFIGSYFPFNRYFPLSSSSQNEVKVEAVEPVKLSPKPVVPDSSVVELVKTDSVATEPVETESVIPVAPESVETKPEVLKPAEVKAATPDKYEAMDARVRTGAYRIIGTAEVVKAREGETLSKLSRRMLGPDMECYLEVYNGMAASTVLKKGQEVKIPKLEWKKKKSTK